MPNTLQLELFTAQIISLLTHLFVSAEARMQMPLSCRWTGALLAHSPYDLQPRADHVGGDGLS